MQRSRYYNLVLKTKLIFKNSNILYLNFDDFNNVDKKKIMIKKIYSFLELPVYNKCNYDIHENKSWTYRFKFINNLIYNKGMLRNLLKNLIPSENIRYKIINYISILNSKEYIKDHNYVNKINDKFININNHECELLIKELDFDIKDWII